MWQKTPEELRQALAAPFSNGDIEWRVSATTQDKTKGLAVPYVTNRAIQNRLDSTVGIDGWQNEFRPWKDGKAQLCGISIYFQQQKQWLTKWDGADDSDFESVKGGLSDSMKRAAVEWGVGRYLYGMTQIWVKIVQRGKGFFIVDEEQPRLDQTHEDWVRKIQSRQASQPQSGKGQQPDPHQGQPQPGAAPQQDSRPGPAPAHQPQPAGAPRPQGWLLPGVRRNAQAHRQRTVPDECSASEGQRPEVPGIHPRSRYQSGPRRGPLQCEGDQPEQRRRYLLCSGCL